ncbi:hypothetical protein [Anaerobacillus alkalilacustris]|nr:hypothetical protein [Anaerobacillus alkalilacustris]
MSREKEQTQKKECKLEDLLSKIKDENKHEEHIRDTQGKVKL